MKFSIKEAGSDKKIFFSFRMAEEETGIHKATLLRILRSGQIYFRRRSDKKMFEIREESDEPVIQIDGKDYYKIEDIEKDFGLSKTVFTNAVFTQGGKYFLDSNGEIHKITWKCSELEKIIETHKKNLISKKSNRRFLHC